MEQSSSKSGFTLGAVAGGVLAAAAAAGAWFWYAPKPQAPEAPAAKSAQAAPPIAAGATLPPNHPPIPAAAGAPPMMGMDNADPHAAAPQPASVEGKIVEVVQVPSYTYLRLQTSGGEIWAAVPTFEAKEGATVTLANTMAMQQFHSKSLNRTFDKILFGTLAQ